MVTFLKPAIENVLRVFYREKNKEVHLRELARQTNLYGQSITRYLLQLERAQILKSFKDGNMKKYGIIKNDLVFSIFSHFDIMEFTALPAIRRNAMLHFLNKLKEQPIVAVVFGSTAKKTFRSDSDIDILLIVNKRIDTKTAQDFADAQTGLRVNGIQIPLAEFKEELKLKMDNVIQSAITTGYPFTNHIQYYRVIYHEGI